MALQMMMQSSRFVVDPGPRPRPRPTAAAHSNAFCLPPPPSPILTSFLVCACASATCTHTRTRSCNQQRRAFLFLLAFPNSRDHYRAHAHAFRFLPSRESYHTLPSLDHTTCLVFLSCESTQSSNRALPSVFDAVQFGWFLEVEIPFSSARLPMIRPSENRRIDTGLEQRPFQSLLTFEANDYPRDRLSILLPFAQDSGASHKIPTSTRTVCALHHIQADSCIQAQLLVRNTDS